MERTVVMKPADNVATCLVDLKAGDVEQVRVDDTTMTIAIKDDIPFGHKVALADVEPGEHVIKYAEVIGAASQAITRGEHVHVHNVESIRARGDKS